MRNLIVLFFLVSVTGPLWARTVASDVGRQGKTPDLTGAERKEVAKMDDGMKTLIYDCIDEGKQMESINQNKTVRNCVNLIKMIYRSHSVKMNNPDSQNKRSVALERQEILKICGQFKDSEQSFCEKFASRFAVQIARPPERLRPPQYTESAGAAR